MKKLLFVSSTILCCIFGNSPQSFADKETPSSGPIVKQSDSSGSADSETITNDKGRDNSAKSASSDDRATESNASRSSDEGRNKIERTDKSVLGGDIHNATNQNKGLIRSSKIKGMDVKSMQDENLGKIEEIMFDRSKGKISYLVLSFGGFLGMGNKFFAMPVHIFNYDAEKDCYRINISKGKLENSPSFDKDHWPSSSDPYWIKAVNDHYK
ncbi:MAG: PRC-barrel domain-containing protein [Alphaproteobacteria bacterium]|nr:PRC-barrel domain-containing protein [Alphaproteobacteria bacterium]